MYVRNPLTLCEWVSRHWNMRVVTTTNISWSLVAYNFQSMQFIVFILVILVILVHFKSNNHIHFDTTTFEIPSTWSHHNFFMFLRRLQRLGQSSSAHRFISVTISFEHMNGSYRMGTSCVWINKNAFASSWAVDGFKLSIWSHRKSRIQLTEKHYRFRFENISTYC